MALNATVKIVSVPPALKKGDVFEARFRATNTGSVPWVAGSHKLGMVGDDAQWGDSRVQLPGPVAPGATAEWSARLAATVGGQRTMTVQMLQEYFAWFGGTDSAQVAVEQAAAPEPPPRSDPGDLLSVWALNTGPLVAVKDKVQADVFKNGPRRKLIRQAKIWVGFDGGTKADCHVEVRRSDGSILSVGQFDHYADGPQGGAVQERDFGDCYFALEAGETLTTYHTANPFTNPAQHYHVTLVLWYHLA